MTKYTCEKLKDLGFVERGFISVCEDFSQEIEVNLQKQNTNRKKVKNLKHKIELTCQLYDEFKNEIKSNNQDLMASLQQTTKAIQNTCSLLNNIESIELEKNFEQLTILRNIWELQSTFSYDTDKNESWLNFLTLVLFDPQNESEYEYLKVSKKTQKFWKLYEGKII